MFHLRSLRAIAGLVLPLWLGACAAPSGCSKAAEPDAGITVENLAPIPAPAGLLADVFVPSPDALWGKARGILGGPATFLPQSFGGLAVTLLRLPIALAAEVDGNVPVLGAAIKTGAEPTRTALGIHVKAGDRFVDQLTKGPEARFTAKVDELSRIAVLWPKGEPPAEGEPVAMGVLGNYLLVARTQAELLAAGPYVARTLPGRAAPKEDVAIEIPESALSGPIVTGAKQGWTAAKDKLEGVGAPTLPLTSAIDSLLAVLGDAAQARITLDLDPGGAHARLALTPKPGGGAASKAIAEMPVGDGKPLLELPSSTIAGVSWRESAAGRAAEIPAQADALAKLLGKDVPDADKDALAAALRAEDEARGDWVALGVALDPTGPSAMVRAPIADQARMSKALQQLIDLGKLPSVKARLRASGLVLTAGKTVVENLPGDVQRVRFERVEDGDEKPTKGAKEAKPAQDAKPAPGATAGAAASASPAASASAAAAAAIPSAIDLLYLVGKDALFGAAGYDAKEALRRVVTAPGAGDLGSDAAVKTAVGAIGGDASFLIFVDPIRLVAARAGKAAPAEPAPVLLAVGRTPAPAALWGRLDVPANAIQELVRHRNAL